MPAPRVNDVVREKLSITVGTALRLSRYFNTTAQFWMNMQSSFDLKVAEREVGSKIESEIRPLQMAA